MLYTNLFIPTLIVLSMKLKNQKLFRNIKKGQYTVISLKYHNSTEAYL